MSDTAFTSIARAQEIAARAGTEPIRSHLPESARAAWDANLSPVEPGGETELLKLRRACYLLTVELAKRLLIDANEENAAAGEPYTWPAQQSWDDLAGTGQSIFRRRAFRAAGLDEEEMVRLLFPHGHAADGVLGPVPGGAEMPSPAPEPDAKMPNWVHLMLAIPDGQYPLGRWRELALWLNGERARLTREKDGAVRERDRLHALLNTPEVNDFGKAVVLEALHQRERWGSEHDAGKTSWDWFWLVGYLAQKAASAQVAGDTFKAKHHTISTAAALANWHAALMGEGDMRPGLSGEVQAEIDARTGPVNPET